VFSEPATGMDKRTGRQKWPQLLAKLAAAVREYEIGILLNGFLGFH